MKNGLALFLGVFAALGLSWAVLLLAAQRQIGSLGRFKDPVDETLYPLPLSGLADEGRLVYQDLGCVSCHTQQVRHEGFGADVERKWGQRGSYARDYIRETTVFIGQSRLGPDLRNAGSVELHAYADADFFYRLLYAPQSVAPGTNMPAHTFLFDVHPTAGRQPSDQAINLSGKYAPAPGNEVVPTTRARALVAYLESLKDTYDYPTERGLNADAEKPREEGAARATTPAEKPKTGDVGNAKPPAATPAWKPKEGGH